jgi:hypothetical protein
LAAAVAQLIVKPVLLEAGPIGQIIHAAPSKRFRCEFREKSMPITPSNPFKGRHFPGEVIVLCVRWYLRYPLAYQHVAELLAERGVGGGSKLYLALGPSLRTRIEQTLPATSEAHEQKLPHRRNI